MIDSSFKQSLLPLSFGTRVLEPESMEDCTEDYVSMNWEERDNAFVEYLSPLIREGALVGDFGCGPGTISSLLARKRPDLRIVGIDLSRSMIEFAEKRAKEEGLSKQLSWRVGDMVQPACAVQEFDFIYSHTSLHHVPRPETFFKQLNRSVRIDGGFCIRDLRHPESAEEAMRWIKERTGDNLTEKQYSLIFHSLRASFRVDEIVGIIKQTNIQGHLEVSEDPKRYWTLVKESR